MNIELEEELLSKENTLSLRTEEFIEQLQSFITVKEEDVDQKKLIEFVQHNRSLLLEGAMRTYALNPKNFELLKVINPLLDSIEKSVREERKERFKNKALETTGASFKDLLESLKHLNEGSFPKTNKSINVGILDPNISILEPADKIKPITEYELKQGVEKLDTEGNVIK